MRFSSVLLLVALSLAASESALAERIICHNLRKKDCELGRNRAVCKWKPGFLNLVSGKWISSRCMRREPHPRCRDLSFDECDKKKAVCEWIIYREPGKKTQSYCQKIVSVRLRRDGARIGSTHRTILPSVPTDPIPMVSEAGAQPYNPLSIESNQWSGVLGEASTSTNVPMIHLPFVSGVFGSRPQTYNTISFESNQWFKISGEASTSTIVPTQSSFAPTGSVFVFRAGTQTSSFDPNISYTLRRDLKSVAKIWEEYSLGFAPYPAVRELEKRNEIRDPFFNEQKVFYDEIERRFNAVATKSTLAPSRDTEQEKMNIAASMDEERGPHKKNMAIWQYREYLRKSVSPPV